MDRSWFQSTKTTNRVRSAVKVKTIELWDAHAVIFIYILSPKGKTITEEF